MSDKQVLLEIIANKGFEEPLNQATNNLVATPGSKLGVPIAGMISEGGYIFKKTEDESTFVVECKQGINQFFLDSLGYLTSDFLNSQPPLKGVFITEIEGKKIRVGYGEGKSADEYTP